MTCRYCASERDTPVLFARMKRATWRPGNPFRRYCPECGRWLKMCTVEEWAGAESPMVLPADADSGDPTLVAAADTEFADLAQRDNRFACPKCGTTHYGYPAECDNCSAVYNWN